MLISGWVKTSLIDYPGKIASVVFTQGCNLKCFYCHNPELIDVNKRGAEIDETEVFDYLVQRKRFLDGVVVTGGEPTLQNSLEYFLSTVKNMGYLVKLDTNGTKPEVLENLISKRLLDYIAMDVKASINKYYEICGEDLDYSCIKESIAMIKKSSVAHEFRTTLAPNLETIDIKNIKGMVGLSSNVFLQKCNGNYKEKSIDEFVETVPQIQLRGF